MKNENLTLVFSAMSVVIVDTLSETVEVGFTSIPSSTH